MVLFEQGNLRIEYVFILGFATLKIKLSGWLIFCIYWKRKINFLNQEPYCCQNHPRWLHDWLMV